MNTQRTKIFTGKLYFFTELAVASSFYTLATLLFYYYTKDESFFIPFYYSGIFFILQLIWQLFQERQEIENEEDEHYPLKISLFCLIATILGGVFLVLYFMFFHGVMTLQFKPVIAHQLLQAVAVDTMPDEYIRIEAVYDDYVSLSFQLNLFDDMRQTPVGCGCGVSFGTLAGTIASPVSPVNFWKKEFDEIVFMPTMTCMCDNVQDCTQQFEQTDQQLYYRINGDYHLAMNNKDCPPKSFNFIEIYDRNAVRQDIQIMLLFILSYIPWMFNFVNFFVNYTKMGFLSFIKSHPTVSSKGVSKMVFYFFLKWACLLLLIFFIAQEILEHQANILIYSIAGIGILPGFMLGIFFYINNPNFKFRQEFKTNINELKDYAESTHESVENFLDVCAVFIGLQFQYLTKATKELLISLSLKGFAQSIFLFGFIAPELLTDFIDEASFQQYPTNIRDNLVINSMILLTGFCHGLIIGTLVLLYQLFYVTSVQGIATCVLCYAFFIISNFWFMRQWLFFKNFKKALAGYITWLYPSLEIRLNRILVNLFFNQAENRSVRSNSLEIQPDIDPLNNINNNPIRSEDENPRSEPEIPEENDPHQPRNRVQFNQNLFP